MNYKLIKYIDYTDITRRQHNAQKWHIPEDKWSEKHLYSDIYALHSVSATPTHGYINIPKREKAYHAFIKRCSWAV